jgi:hypothetical protein
MTLSIRTRGKVSMPERQVEDSELSVERRILSNNAPLPIIVFVRLLIQLVSVACPSGRDSRFTVVSLSPPSKALDSPVDSDSM